MSNAFGVLETLASVVLLAADFKRFSFINSAHLPPIDAPMRLPSHRALWRLCCAQSPLSITFNGLNG